MNTFPDPNATPERIAINLLANADFVNGFITKITESVHDGTAPPSDVITVESQGLDLEKSEW